VTWSGSSFQSQWAAASATGKARSLTVDNLVARYVRRLHITRFETGIIVPVVKDRLGDLS